MPFGLIFGAVFFAGLCSWAALRWISDPLTTTRVAGAALLVLGVSLALALLRRRRWARGAGVVAAVAMFVFVLQAVRILVVPGRYPFIFQLQDTVALPAIDGLDLLFADVVA